MAKIKPNEGLKTVSVTLNEHRRVEQKLVVPEGVPIFSIRRIISTEIPRMYFIQDEKGGVSIHENEKGEKTKALVYSVILPPGSKDPDVESLYALKDKHELRWHRVGKGDIAGVVNGIHFTPEVAKEPSEVGLIWVTAEVPIKVLEEKGNAVAIALRNIGDEIQKGYGAINEEIGVAIKEVARSDQKPE